MPRHDSRVPSLILSSVYYASQNSSCSTYVHMTFLRVLWFPPTSKTLPVDVYVCLCVCEFPPDPVDSLWIHYDPDQDIGLIIIILNCIQGHFDFSQKVK